MVAGNGVMAAPASQSIPRGPQKKPSPMWVYYALLDAAKEAGIDLDQCLMPTNIWKEVVASTTGSTSLNSFSRYSAALAGMGMMEKVYPNDGQRSGKPVGYRIIPPTPEAPANGQDASNQEGEVGSKPEA